MRPTGLVDPEVVVKPTKGQIDDLMEQINDRVSRGDRVLVTTLTKKMSEDLTDYLLELGVRRTIFTARSTRSSGSRSARPLPRRVRCARRHDLLREAFDRPEVSRLAILMPTRRASSAARRRSSRRSAGPPQRRRPGDHVRRPGHAFDGVAHLRDQLPAQPQIEYNLEHDIDPQTIRKAVTDILAYLRSSETVPVPGKDAQGPGDRRGLRAEPLGLLGEELGRLIRTFTDEMHEASADLASRRSAVAGRDQGALGRVREVG